METPTTDNYYSIAKHDDDELADPVAGTGTGTSSGTSTPTAFPVHRSSSASSTTRIEADPSLIPSEGGCECATTTAPTSTSTSDAVSPSSVKAAKQDVRRARIAAAVQRSKSEYRPEHAITERGWMHIPDSGPSASLSPTSAPAPAPKPKMDIYNLEHLTTSLYLRGEHHEVLQRVMAAFDPSKGTALGGLSRALVDTGTRAAVALGGEEGVGAGVRLAESGSSSWKTFVGMADAASDAYLAAGRRKDAFRPLLIASASAGGVQQALVSRLESLTANDPDPHCAAFHALAAYHTHRTRPPGSTLFSEDQDEDEDDSAGRSAHEQADGVGRLRDGESIVAPEADSAVIDVNALLGRLGLDEDMAEPLRDTVRKLSRTGAPSGQESKEKSVREL